MKLKTNPDCLTCQQRMLCSFALLTDEQLRLVNQSKTTRFVRKESLIFEEGDSTRRMHCVNEGKVKLYKTLPDGTVQILRIAKAGDLIGYRGLLGNGRYIASAETLEDSVLCLIHQDIIFRFIEENLKFTLSMFSKIAADIDEAEKRNTFFASKNSRERLAESILIMEESFGLDAFGFINIILSRVELGSLTGMAAETVVRVLHQLQDEGCVLLDKKKISIRDKSKLQTIARTAD